MLIAALLISGCVLDKPEVTIDCENLTASLKVMNGRATIDNSTGGGRSELVQGEIKDGFGNILVARSYGPQPVGESTYGVANFGPYTMAEPKANPITVTLFTPAGGSLTSDQVFLTYTTTCPGLPVAAAKAPTPVPAVGIPALIFGALSVFGAAGFLSRRRRSA